MSDLCLITRDIRLRNLFTGDTSREFVGCANGRGYNNIADWKYGKLLEVFGAENPKSFKVETKDELKKLLSDKEFADAKDIQVHRLPIEI
jgi:TPP-dependent 2-oxoacid decarboxylase